ncbi:AAA domain-containing protein [Vararia minispora EC-137]|uniref:AAA domain-containing protein n=1 Tax=Vararia minispora EC-137 TaxID=1314806 RepID=A0ACB8QFZ5_9AGAM|nr:AAA domain-containing protein [Vararia minispora EC-137]
MSVWILALNPIFDHYRVTHALCHSTINLAVVHWLDVRSVFCRVVYPPTGILTSKHADRRQHLATLAADPASSSRTDFVHNLVESPEPVHDAPVKSRFDWRRRASLEKPLSSSRPPVKYRRRVEPTHSPLMPHDSFFREVYAYQKRFLPLLEVEQQEEEKIIQERLSSWSVQRLKSEGYCVTELSAFWMEQTHFGRPVAAFSLGPGVTLPNNRFENGTQVLVTHLDPLKESPRRGRVLGATSTQIRISFQSTFDLNEDGKAWRLDVGRSDIAFERMRTAVSHFAFDPLFQEAASDADDREIILQGTTLRDILLRAFKPGARVPSPHEPVRLQDGSDSSYVPRETLDHPGHFIHRSEGAFADDMRIMSWARRYSLPDPISIEGDPVLAGLNPTQVRAAAMMIGQRASLVQGPPGTGKTKTIIQALTVTKREFDVALPVLVCTYTNVAVDNLVEGFSQAGLNPVRVGSEGMIRETLQRHSLQAQLSVHPDIKQLDVLSADLAKTEKRLNDSRMRINKLRDSIHDSQSVRALQTLDNMKSSAFKLERQVGAISGKMSALKAKMIKDIFLEADVVRSRHVALIGDHKQLPPVILSSEARDNGLGISLFERLTEEGVIPSIMLDVQYRMHPSIAHFPSQEFYGMALRDGMVDALGNVPDYLLPPKSEHLLVDTASGHRPSVVFLDHSGPESISGRSRINMTDATIVCSVIEDILALNADIMGSDIGVIAPYAAQVRILSQLLTTEERSQTRFKSKLGDHRAMQVAGVEVKTVDGFEGREKEVIIFSTVRNNAGGYVGFLSDRRRLNVGLTRAKRGLFVIGSLRTLGAANTGELKAKRGLDSLRNTSNILPPLSSHTLTTTIERRPRSKSGAWVRYMEYLKERGMILPLEGERLRRMVLH